mmetsp:Transcript_82166/g.180601  ORF Transcript_82166/g.180601 Transcript_82166/m.180601 type:complete len:158 (-) Transcript_82166:707-1180(-)
MQRGEGTHMEPPPTAGFNHTAMGHLDIQPAAAEPAAFACFKRGWGATMALKVTNTTQQTHWKSTEQSTTERNRAQHGTTTTTSPKPGCQATDQDQQSRGPSDALVPRSINRRLCFLWNEVDVFEVRKGQRHSNDFASLQGADTELHHWSGKSLGVVQ